MIWFWSDHHYFHRGIIRLARRPFSSIAEMHETFRRNNNKVVSNEDIVVYIGDVSAISTDRMRSVMDEYVGDRMLLRGNHDRGPFAMRKAGFPVVLHEAVFKLRGKTILVRHRPLDFLPDGIDGIFHGHVHRTEPTGTYGAGETLYIPPFNVNLCVEMTNYAPVTYLAALRTLRSQLSGK